MLINPYRFDPAYFAARVMDFDPGKMAYSHLDNMDECTDSSGNGNHGTQSSSSNQPRFEINQINGLPAIRFPSDPIGSNTTPFYFDLPDLSAELTEAEVFVVLKNFSDPPNEPGTGLWKFDGSAVPTVVPYSNGTIYDGFCSTARKSTADPSPDMAVWNIYNVTSKSGSWTNRINGTELFTTASNTFDYPADAKLGWYNGIYYFSGWIGRFVFFNRELTGDERADFLARLQSKYNL